MIVSNTQLYSKKVLRGIGSIIQYLFCVLNSGLLKILIFAKINFSTKQYGYFVIFTTNIYETEIRFSFVKARLLTSHSFPASSKLIHEWVFIEKVTKIFHYLECSSHFLPKLCSTYLKIQSKTLLYFHNLVFYIILHFRRLKRST